MNSNETDSHNEDGEAAPEYDFSHSVRGKHAKAMRAGYTMIIHKSDGATEVREVAPGPGTVMLDPDVRAYFPDSEAVNRALRGFISLIPQQHPAQGESH